MAASNISWVDYVAVACGILVFACQGYNASQIGPFFPPEARGRGVSQTVIGLIISVFDLTETTGAVIIGAVVQPIWVKRIFVFGGFTGSSSVIAFGLIGLVTGKMAFTILSFLFRMTMGFGASMIWCNSIPILTAKFPQHGGFITSLIQLAFGVGLNIGPLLGNVMFNIQGYYLPYVFAGLLQVISVIFFVLFHRGYTGESGSEKHQKSEHNFFWLFSRPWILCVTPSFMCSTSIFGFLDAAYANYLETSLNIPEQDEAYYFIPLFLAYAVACPVVGIVIDKGYGSILFCIFSLLSSIFVLLMALPGLVPALESGAFMCFCLFGIGGSVASVIVVQYLVIIHIALSYDAGSAEAVKLMVSSFLSVSFAGGKMTGPALFGGVMTETLGFYWSAAALGATGFIASAMGVLCVWQNGLIRKIYYPTENSESSRLLHDNETDQTN